MALRLAGDLLVGVRSGSVRTDRTMYGPVAGRRGAGGYVAAARAYTGPCGNGSRCAGARVLGLDAGVLAAAVREVGGRGVSTPVVKPAGRARPRRPGIETAERVTPVGSGGAAPRPHHHMRKRSQTRMTDHKLRNPHHREEGASMGSGGDLVSYSSWRRRRGTRYAPSLHGTSNRRKRP